MSFSPSIIFTLVGAAVVLMLTSCGSQPKRKTITVVKTKGFNPNHGPFDSRGNYVEAWADAPPKRIYVSPEEFNKKHPDRRIASVPTPPEVIEPPVVTHRPKPTTRPTYRPKPNPTTRPKPTVVKVKPKRRPPIVHTVKKGDTLYSLSRKYKSGVKTIQIANGLKGNTIRIGQKLKIPRY